VEIGVVLPQTDIGGEAAGLRKWAVTAEALGYRHVMVYDHVVGADRLARPGWTGAFDRHSAFHEPLVLFGYLAGITTLSLLTGILILPQRQTVLVAKQATEVDLLSGGRLRVGVGLGWNHVEYEALGMRFAGRGKRLEDQVTLLRALWTEESVSFHGRSDQAMGVGLAPLPQQQPIPLWFGGNSVAAYERAGRLGDGWIPDRMLPGPDLRAAKAVVERSARAAGRDPAQLGLQGRVRLVDRPTSDVDVGWIVQQVDAWRATGATHVAIDTMGAGIGPLPAHLDVLLSCAEALGLSTPTPRLTAPGGEGYG
jgi:probable F420-dependent oxidoreductase